MIKIIKVKLLMHNLFVRAATYGNLGIAEYLAYALPAFANSFSFTSDSAERQNSCIP